MNNVLLEIWIKTKKTFFYYSPQVAEKTVLVVLYVSVTHFRQCKYLAFPLLQPPLVPCT